MWKLELYIFRDVSYLYNKQTQWRLLLHVWQGSNLAVVY